MENCMENLLKDFYLVAVHNHNKKHEKIQVLQHFLSKIHSTLRPNGETFKSNAGVEFQTQASIGDIEAFSINSRQTQVFSSNMLYTFLFSNNGNQSENACKITSKALFADSSIFKVLTYSIFINFLHINKESAQVLNNENLTHSLHFAQLTLKKLKIAMVNAAQHFKGKDKKKYIKIRYLYDQLLNYTEKNSSFKQEYIKIIIEEFDNDFLKKTFENLQLKCNELLYSQSICSNISLGDSVLTDSIIVEEVNRALEYLQVKLILMSERRNIEVELCDKKLNIVVQEVSNGVFKLSEIITIRDSEGFAQL